MNTEHACNHPRCDCLDPTVEGCESECTGDRACTAAAHIEGCFSTDVDVAAQLERCGDGEHDTPWKTDELVKLAKMLRGARA